MRQQGGNQTSCKIIVAAEDYIRCKLFQAPDDLLRLAVAFFHSQCGEWFPRLFKCLFQSVEFFPARIGENAFIMKRRQINPLLAALFQKMFRRQKGSRRMVNEDIGIFDSRRRAEYRGNQRAEPGFGKRVVCRRDDQPVDSFAEQVPDCTLRRLFVDAIGCDQIVAVTVERLTEFIEISLFLDVCIRCAVDADRMVRYAFQMPCRLIRDIVQEFCNVQNPVAHFLRNFTCPFRIQGSGDRLP